MGYNRQRKLYETLPPPVKRLVHLVPFSWVAGNAYRKVMQRHAFFNTASRAECLAYQEEQLKDFLLAATRHVEAYRPHRDIVERLPALEALKDFPPIDKETIQQDFDRYLPDNLHDIPHYEVSTGGTSGNQLTFFLDDDSQRVETAFIHRLWSLVDYHPRFRKATFRGVSAFSEESDKYWYDNPIYNELQFSPFHINEANLPAYIDRLINYKPVFIHGYPSAISQVADYINRHGRHDQLPEIKAVILSSEGPLPGQVERISRAFGCRTVSFFGHSERLILAGECEHDTSYHHVPDYGILEILDEDGSAADSEGDFGELVGTGLNNRSLPLIRYRTGDFATRLEPVCRCGRHWDRITDVRGRWHQDFLVGENGERISLTALNMHHEVFENVERYQYYQKEQGSCVLRVIPRDTYDERDGEAIVAAFSAKTGSAMRFGIETVKEIPRTTRGKHRLLVTDISKKNMQ